jgi:hypothetical protein
MGRSKEQYVEQLYRLHGDDIDRLARKRDELWQEYYVMMARKYFPDGCHICKSKKSVILTDSSIVYGSSYGLIYYCTNCKAYVGVHEEKNNPHGEENAPKGYLADRQMRQLRKLAHQYFDPLWQDTKLSRRGAYKVLQRATGVPEERAHIAMLTKKELNKLIQYFRNLKVNRK